MKKLVLIISTCLLLSGCGVKAEDYNQLKSNYDTLASNQSGVETKLNDTLAKLKESEDSYISLKKEFDSYKESMEEFETLAESEAKARQIEADKVIKAEEEEKAKKEAEELAAKEAKEKAGYETGITFDDLARTPDDFLSEKVKFSGKVVQVVEGSGFNALRFAINKDYDKMIYCEYSKDIVTSRILEDDIITIYGYSLGLKSYQSTMGATITIPNISVDKIDQ